MMQFLLEFERLAGQKVNVGLFSTEYADKILAMAKKDHSKNIQLVLETFNDFDSKTKGTYINIYNLPTIAFSSTIMPQQTKTRLWLHYNVFAICFAIREAMQIQRLFACNIRYAMYAHVQIKRYVHQHNCFY